MGFFDELIKQKDGEYIPVWQWVNGLAISHDSDIQAVIAHLQTTYKDLTIYRRDEKAVYTPKRKTWLGVYDERTIFEDVLGTLQSYIDCLTGKLNVYDLEHKTASNPTYTDYLKKSELPTFGEQSPSMAGVNDNNNPDNAGEIIAGLQTRILDLKRQLNATTANNDSQQQIADLQAENARLQARIAELESQAKATPTNDDIELTGTSKKAVTKLLYALLREHNYSIDGTTKGATNQILENLTKRHDVSVSRETIAKWLNEINTLYYNNNK